MFSKSFNPIPLANPRSIRFYNREDGLTEQTITKNVEMFIDDINTGKFDVSSHFSWYEKPVPLAVKYLLWKGISVMTPSEEIMQVTAYEKDSKSRCKFTGNEQWWHDWADKGFDIFTSKQFKDLMGDNIDKYEHKLWKKGLILLSTRPGFKYQTRNEDPNDPLNWAKKKKEFDYKCATCGDPEGKYSSSNGIPVRLEQGHIDARIWKSHSNIIPQCGSCNNHSDKSVYGPSENDPKRYIVIEKLTRYNQQQDQTQLNIQE
jgi:hypothetical protein